MGKRFVLLAVVLSSVASAAVIGTGAIAQNGGGLPADKVSASGNDLRTTSDQNAPIRVLSERMRVSTTSDLVLQLTSECSILTALNTTGGDTESEADGSFGQVKMFITIDGNRVPVSTNDTPNPPPEEFDNNGDDFGEVVFCNRAYQRTVTDMEDDMDGLDGEDDFIRTRTANAFNWLALNVGDDFDSDANGNNIIDVEVFAEFSRRAVEDGMTVDPQCTNDGGNDADLEPLGETCAEAFIGSRTLTIEPTHAAVNQTVQP